MDINNFLYILLRRKWVIIITAAVTLVAVITGTLLMKPKYTATTTLRIATASASSTSYTDYMFADRLITTYINIATSQPLMDKLTSRLNLAKPPKITVTQVPDSELIRILVVDRDPQMAMDAANTLGTILVSEGQEFYTGTGKSPADVLKVQVDQAQSDLNKLRADYYNHLEKYPDDTAGIQEASQAVDLQQQLYYSLLSQYQELKTREAIQSNIISFVEMASLPVEPSFPNKPLNAALGLVIGLIGGIGLALLFENMDSTLHSFKEINQVVNIHPIGRIPTIPKKWLKNSPVFENSMFEESISRLRTNFLTLNKDSTRQTLLIASSMQGEGKTLLASKLAISLAQSGKKVILVDCDLHISSIHKIFNLKNIPGLSDYLADNVNLEKIIRKSRFENLHLITGGRPDGTPALLLNSPKMENLIEELKKTYDIILLDSPAVLAVTDASIIAPLVDGVLMLARLGVTRKEKLNEAVEQLQNVEARLVGLVVNGDHASGQYYYYTNRKPLRLKGR